VTQADRDILGGDAQSEGWRLGCRLKLQGDVELEIGTKDLFFLHEEKIRDEGALPRELAIAIDTGTTSLVAQLIEVGSGRVVGSESAANPQGTYGADVMSRLHHCQSNPHGQVELSTVIREKLGELVHRLLLKYPSAIRSVNLVGNTAMHHLFAQLPTHTLAQLPYEPATLDAWQTRCGTLNWDIPGDPNVVFHPNLGGFVGSDILAGVLAMGMQSSTGPVALIDLGTNGELVIGDHSRLYCASTAAGPAFEGARISMGMRAETGAIDRIDYGDEDIQFHVLGGTEPRGICGSGLIDAAALALDQGHLLSDGRLVRDDRWHLHGMVHLTQKDFRELQLAKAAIAAGFHLLLEHAELDLNDLEAIYVAGAFGQSLNLRSAKRIGLLAGSDTQLQLLGNTALHGARMAAAVDMSAEIKTIRRITEHVELAELPGFHDRYAEALHFPEPSDQISE